ncbi:MULTISPECIES: stage II sporulation protein M [Thermoanaerobacterium]|uniref:Stage II sporulation protein M n=1 Tax=Thermoanaerobacterium xylanolyticum (strain ATCC 49914 / DSM 7097 / LX-11) TaxID=858215 RepID=F6BLJ0_THEXL|nr:stage II sporulation protein M [Thermoanaerobacterium xylanolyticum]AEF17237.1 stage II sporulation protein M [Thermoanaerobacterium xylanolyticum LX-11]
MKYLKEKTSKHIRDNSILYIIILMSFMIGIASGSFTINTLNDVQKENMMKYIKNFYVIISQMKIVPIEIFKQSVLNNFETTFVLWLLGATIIGIPFIFIVIGIRGFLLGFSVGFLINQLKYKGILFTLVAILPQNILALISLFFISATAINFSMYILKNRRFNINDLFSQFVTYTLLVYFAFSLMILSGVFEAYLTPKILYFLKNIIQ